MKKIAIIALSTFLVLMMVPTSLIAGDTDPCFTRVSEIPMPEVDLNTGGIGAVISNVDVDGDGMTELYIANNMYDNVIDGAHEEVPRIYKLEWDGTAWNMVWHVEAPVPFQNTWPVLLLTDLDDDGKQELTWMPANNFATEANPDRILVYEHQGGTSDEFGYWGGGSLGWQPNSMWAFPTEDGVNVRPMHGAVSDIDGDGKQEVLFADRKGNNGGYYFGVASVDNIPDNGDGTETWTMETSGLDHTLSDGPENKWTVAVVGPNAYVFSETEISKISWDGAAYTYTALDPLLGSPNQSAEVVDLDGDGIFEIVCAIYDWADDAEKSVWLLQEDGAGDLTRTQLHNYSANFTSRGAWGSTSGDIDGDGYLDFIFGSRGGTDTENAQIFKYSYMGGDITDQSNYMFSVIDQNYAATGGVWSIVNLANVDADPELEVLYGSSQPYGGDLFNDDGTGPLVVLDYDTNCEAPTVGIEGTETVVDGYKLGQNYPNPFNPTTNITLEIPSNDLVTLTIYDMLGHSVKTLVKQNLAQGEYRVTWDGKDNSGVTVPAGTYVYQLKAGDVVKIRKMTYIK